MMATRFMVWELLGPAAARLRDRHAALDGDGGARTRRVTWRRRGRRRRDWIRARYPGAEPLIAEPRDGGRRVVDLIPDRGRPGDDRGRGRHRVRRAGHGRPALGA